MTPDWAGARRLGGLRRFAAAITLLNCAGHAWLGFESSWAQPLVALAGAYLTELLIEGVDARIERRAPRFSSGPRALVDFLLSAHVSGLAVSMLLYANERLAVIAFAASAAIVTKALLRVPLEHGGSRHFLNPSNAGICLTLLLFPWVSIAPPYQFTRNLTSAGGDWILPLFVLASGSLLNARYTQRLPLIGAWLAGFAAQAILRAALAAEPVAPRLAPMTGVAFLLFTFYMVTDPATTPSGTRGQIAFGLSVAGSYAALMHLHVVFGLFFALGATTAARGLALGAQVVVRRSTHARSARPASPSVVLPAAKAHSVEIAGPTFT